MVNETNLSQWQSRLADHFSQLLSIRKSLSESRPIFALEHGLDANERDALAKSIQAHIAHHIPVQKDYLPWVVYASELGYRYSGDEYWQTFEEDTPGWIVRGNRYWIRRSFQLFQEKYNGAQPSGAWANHFSIICWPITHAILPKDLQRQLARILYELRHSLSGELLDSPSQLGELVAARSWNATLRFQNLAQAPQLVGQIAAALILHGELGSDSLIHNSTLRRISEDLDLERRAREWLRSARQIARERKKIRGLGLLSSSTTSNINHPDKAREEVAALGIEPRLILRQIDTQSDSWSVSIEIPDLSHIMFRFPQTREILTGSRCVVAGAVGRPLARGRCLYGVQRVKLARWPQADEVLLQFEQSDNQLDFLLRTECLLRPGPIWLFRIASDGLAYELRSLRVRPGEEYILVDSSGSMLSLDQSRSIDLKCEGVVGMRLDLPSALTQEWEEKLCRLGLRQAKTVEVWPAGLAPAVWDGEGHGEWLASEQPCLALCVDHPIDGLLVNMTDSNDPPLYISPITPGEPVFLELPQLPVGLHRVRVSARTSPEVEVEALGELDIVMRIKEARPWSSCVSPQGPLHVLIDPSEPSLERMWEGNVDVNIRGPNGSIVVCAISLFEREGNTTAVFSKQLPPMKLPITADDWRKHFDEHFRGTRTAQEAYDAARFSQFEFKANELGNFKLHCSREFTPLRWALRRRSNGYSIRLFDDLGDDAKPTIKHLSFEAPIVEEPVSFLSEYEVPALGGLYVARLHNLTAAIIIPPMVHSLEDLRCTPRIVENQRSLESIIRMLRNAYLWGLAKLPGDLLSATRKREVLLELGFHCTRLICGDNWARVELGVQRGLDNIFKLKDEVSRQRYQAAIGVVLERDCSDLAGASTSERVKWLASLIKRYHVLSSSSISDDSEILWHSEFALRLASNPYRAQTWAGERLQSGVKYLMDFPTLMRAARFLVLLIDHQLQSKVRFDELYAGWEWR